MRGAEGNKKGADKGAVWAWRVGGGPSRRKEGTGPPSPLYRETRRQQKVQAEGGKHTDDSGHSGCSTEKALHGGKGGSRRKQNDYWLGAWTQVKQYT